MANTGTVPTDIQLPTIQAPKPAKPIDVASQEEQENPKSQEKPNEDLKSAQAAANKLQWIIESSMACLIQQAKYPLNTIGIIESYVPQKKIETIGGVSTIGSLFISGISYMKIHGLPSSSPERLFGKCKSLNLNKFNQGALDNFTDMSSLDAKAQEKKFNDYKTIHQNTVMGFLQHFSDLDTFHRRPEVCVRGGITPCSLQQAMMNCGVEIEGAAPDGNWMIIDVLDKLTEKQYMDIAETMVANFEKFK